MNTFTLYRIPLDQVQPLRQILPQKGFQPQKTIEVDGFDLEFFLLQPPQTGEVSWATLYQAFLPDGVDLSTSNHAAVLLIHNTDIAYAVSLGSAFHTIRKVADPEFGLNLAQRIVNESQLQTKVSKFFQAQRNRTISSYNDGTPLYNESGESVQQIQAKTVDPKEWGSTIKFSQSISFRLDIEPSELPAFVRKVETELAKPEKFVLPRTEKVTDPEKIASLDRELAGAIMGGAEPTDADSGNPSPTLAATDFIESDHGFTFVGAATFEAFCKKREAATKTVLDDFHLKPILTLARKWGLTQENILEDFRLRTVKEDGKKTTSGLREMLNYTHPDGHCLLQGKWVYFNQSYIGRLKEMADGIPLVYDAGMDEKRGVTEPQFLEKREKEGFLSFHTKSVRLENEMNRYKVEEMDLYQDKTMYCVKVGPASKMAYAVDQAINTTRLLQHKKHQVHYKGKYYPVKTVSVWLVLDRRTPIERISDINSLILMMKLDDFRRTVQDAGLIPQIRINYLGLRPVPTT